MSMTTTFFATPKPAQPTHIAPLDHVLKARDLATDRAARGAAATMATMQLVARGIDIATFMELVSMQDAIWARYKALGEGWLQSWEAWAKYAGQLKGANTMSKFVERECNIAGQAIALVMKQMTDIAGLEENVEVDYAYWVSEKLAEQKASAVW